MAQNKTVRFGPIALTATLTTNILNPPTTTGGTNCGTPTPYIILRHIRIVNKTGVSHNFTFYLGLTGANTAGTEVLGVATVVAANSYFDWYGLMTLETTDFLVGGADALTSLVFQAEGEIGLR